ncbi:hypothetical protein BDW02DRAFT_565550 [Decorospora gaudefroyi]|uniref:Uncharacterized protein n=1 Tax=Decorospora gaudefroyi TaxID=184978 RepID=A0A6A5KL45_9PLEO|nr:hypothetical protein BDW02DRAFT_565550 [Decorospora gaudefroyi]
MRMFQPCPTDAAPCSTTTDGGCTTYHGAEVYRMKIFRCIAPALKADRPGHVHTRFEPSRGRHLSTYSKPQNTSTSLPRLPAACSCLPQASLPCGLTGQPREDQRRCKKPSSTLQRGTSPMARPMDTVRARMRAGCSENVSGGFRALSFKCSGNFPLSKNRRALLDRMEVTVEQPQTKSSNAIIRAMSTIFRH